MTCAAPASGPAAAAAARGRTRLSRTGGGLMARRSRLDTSEPSPVIGADDAPGRDVVTILIRAARAVPNSASRSSFAEPGRTVDEISVRVGRDGDMG